MKADHSHHVVHTGMVGCQRHSLLQGFVGFCTKFHLDTDDSEEEMDGDVVRRERPCVTQIAERLFVRAGLVYDPCEVDENRHTVG